LPYFAGLSSYHAESGSLSLCADYFLLLPSDPIVTNNALAIRIVFPSVGVTPVSFDRTDLSALLSKQKKAHLKDVL